MNTTGECVTNCDVYNLEENNGECKTPCGSECSEGGCVNNEYCSRCKITTWFAYKFDCIFECPSDAMEYLNIA